MEGLYERGLNSLVMHWRSQYTSKYYGSEGQGEAISAVLRLTDSYDFITLEEDTLRMSLFAAGSEELASLEPGHLYNVRIRIDIQSA